MRLSCDRVEKQTTTEEAFFNYGKLITVSSN
jgi:hypothetical protein